MEAKEFSGIPHHTCTVDANCGGEGGESRAEREGTFGVKNIFTIRDTDNPDNQGPAIFTSLHPTLIRNTSTWHYRPFLNHNLIPKQRREADFIGDMDKTIFTFHPYIPSIQPCHHHHHHQEGIIPPLPRK